MRNFHRTLAAVTSAALVATALSSCAVASKASSGAGRVTIGVPGIPPVFVNLPVYVARAKGYFKSRGLTVTIRPLATATDVGRAVTSGQITTGIVGTSSAVALRAQGAPVVALVGFPKADYLVATDDSSVTGCASLKGKTIGVDAAAAPKTIALGAMLASCGLKATDVRMVNLGGPQDVDALLAGQVKTAVLHTDELAAVLARKAGVRTAVTSTTADPLQHYAMMISRQSTVKGGRPRSDVVKMVAALHRAILYINDPAHLQEVAATAAKMTNEPIKVAAGAVTAFVKMGFWPTDNGLAGDRINHVIQQQVAAGNITQSKTPTTAQLINTTVYDDAVK